jgi:hypothetical protein
VARLHLIVLLLVLGCAVHTRPVDPRGAPFRFPADTFSFANETIWVYDVVPETGEVSWRERDPRPPFALRCGSMARAARQFYSSARFDSSAPAADPATYTALVRAVFATDPRRPRGEGIMIPGYADLRSFSADHEHMLRTEIAGPWLSYLQRGNWRMIFPFTANNQKQVAERLLASLAEGWPPIAHVLRYPWLTVNHQMLVFAAEETPSEIRFRTYDPNEAAHDVVLTYDRAAHIFYLAVTPYFPGGPVKVYETYHGLLY